MIVAKNNYTVEGIKARYVKRLHDCKDGSDLRPLFDEDGGFNPGNQGSGQDIRDLIREYDNGDELLEKRMSESFTNWYRKNESEAYGVFCARQETPRLTCLVIDIMIDEGRSREKCEHYTFAWNDIDANKTEKFERSGKPGTISDYSRLLGILHRVGFFDPDL